MNLNHHPGIPPNHPNIPARYRPNPQLVRGTWVLARQGSQIPVWKLFWWADIGWDQILARRTGVAARMATPDRVVATAWLEPQDTPEAAMVQLIDSQGLDMDTPMPEVEQAPGSLEELEGKTPSQRAKALMGYTS